MARVIAELFKSTDIDSLYLEANIFDIMKTVGGKITERHRRRPAGDPLRVKALGTTPKVRASKAYHNDCWQQRADKIQERFGVLTRQHLMDKNNGKLKNTFDYTVLTVTEDTADIVFFHRAPLGDPHNSIPPEAATDIKVHFYPQLTDPVSASSPADVKLRSATETIRLLRQRARGAIWELWTDGAVAR